MTNEYQEMLDKGAYPSVQSRIASLYYVETERICLWNDITTPTPLQKAVYDETEKSIEILKAVLNRTGISRFREKVVFFRETMNRVEENLLLLKKREQLQAEAEEVLDYIALSDLPENLRKNLLNRVDEAMQSFKKSTVEFPDGVFLLRKALHCLNDFLDEIYRDMYFVKITITAHLVALGISLSQLGFCYLVFKGAYLPFTFMGYEFIGNHYRLDPAIAFYLFSLLLGAAGGNVGALIGEIQPSSGKGTFLVNIITTVISRILVGAASAIGTVLIIKSELLLRISANATGGAGFVVSDPYLALLTISFVAGIGGERWLRSSVDQLIAKLTVSATKNKGDGAKSTLTEGEHLLEKRIKAIVANTETGKAGAAAGDEAAA